MSTYETPEPIFVTLDLGVANVRLAASDRTDTVVEVRPTDDADASDVQAAGQVRVECTNGTLQITGPRRAFDFSKKTRSVDLSIELPSGSQVSAHLLMGHIRGAGRLGECQLRTTGNVSLDQTGPLRLHTGAGAVSAEGVTGDADISTGSGKVHLGEVEGAAAVKNSNGDTTIGAATGDVLVRNSNGAITVGRAGAGVDAKTANGGIRLGEVARGPVTVGTAAGDLDLGIAKGTAAWVEVNTGFGHVRNQLDDATGPEASGHTVEVRGRTSYGDITIHRA